MMKLYKARSVLYRRQILQENIRWKAVDEIYKIYMRPHRSEFRQALSHVLQCYFQNVTYLKVIFCNR